MDLFEKATRNKWRFACAAGNISVEDLWSLPLTSTRKGMSLDDIAKGVYKEIKDSVEESFVSTSSGSAKKTLLEDKLSLLKHIISVRLEEAKAKRDSVAKAEQKQKILAIIESKKEEALANKDEAELIKMLGEL